jgi:hypothetical protein
MSVNKHKNTYDDLCKEYIAVVEETKLYKNNLSTRLGKRMMNIWDNSTYLDELLYIKKLIKKEMTQHLIVYKMKIYKYLEYSNIPKDIITNISYFGNTVDTQALYFISKNVEANIETISLLC